MTQSYFEYLGRQEAAPFTNEKLDYEKTEPDLTKQVNAQIDKNILDRKEFFAAEIERYNKTVAGQTTANLKNLLGLTRTSTAYLAKRQEYAEDRKAFDEFIEIYKDPEKRGTYATVEKNIEQVEGELKNDEDVEIATIESSGKDTSGQVVSGTQLLDFKKTIAAEEFLNGRHASKSMSTYWPIYLDIARNSLTYNNKLYSDLTFSEKKEWMKVAGANFVAMFAKANPRMTESQVINNFMPSFDSTSKSWDGQSYDVENNAVNNLRSNTADQNYTNAINVAAEAWNNPNVNYTISSVYSKAGFIANKTSILQASGHPNPRQEANRLWADMIIRGIDQDQFSEQAIEYILYHDKFVAEQHKGTGKLSSYSDIQPKNANRIAQAFINRNEENNKEAELQKIAYIKGLQADGQEVPRDILTTFSNEDLRTQAEELLDKGEMSEFDRPEFSILSKDFKEYAAIQAQAMNPKKYSSDLQWRLQTSNDIYDNAGEFFKTEYNKRYTQSGNRDDALEFAREKTKAAITNGDFNNVLSDIISDNRILKSRKLADLYNADIKAALNSKELLAGEEDPVLNAEDYFNGKVDQLDSTWTILARLYKNKGPLKLAHDRLVVLNRIKPIPELTYNTEVKVLDSPLLNHHSNATKVIQAAENGITNSENYNEMLGALSKNQEQNGGVNAIKGPDGNYVTELPLGKPLSEHTIQEVYQLVQDGYNNICLYDMTPTALTQVFNSNIGTIDFTKPFDEVAQSKLLMSRLYHKANNQHLFGNADTSYRRLMNFTEDQIEKYESLIDEIPPFLRLNTLYGPAAKEAVDLNL